MKKACEKSALIDTKMLGYIQFNNRWAFDNIEFLREALNQTSYFMNNFWTTIWELATDYWAFKNIFKSKPKTRLAGLWIERTFNNELKRFINTIWQWWISAKKNWLEATFKVNEIWKDAESIKNFLLNWTITDSKWWIWRTEFLSDSATKWNMTFSEIFIEWSSPSLLDLDNFVNIITSVKNTYEAWWYDWEKLLKFMWKAWEGWDFFATLMVWAQWNLKASLVNQLLLTDTRAAKDSIQSNILSKIEWTVAVQWLKVTDWQLKSLVRDLLWESLYKSSWMWQVQKAVNEVRSVYSFLKFTWWMVSWPLLAMNAFVIGSSNFLAKKIWLPLSTDHKIVDFFLDELNVLKASSTYKDMNVRLDNEIGWTKFWWLTDKVFNPEKHPILNTIARSWWQSVPDMMMESSVKRLAVTNALSAWWITYKNADVVLDMLKKWRWIDTNILKDIHGKSETFWTNYYTHWNILALSRNRFSSWFAINAMQWYMFSRAWEVLNAMHNVARDISDWKLNTWAKFIDYIEDPAHRELKTFIYMPFLTGKMWYYLDSMVWKDEEDENQSKRIVEYAVWLNDYMQSMTQNFFWRIVTWMFETWWAYLDYTDINWEQISLYGWVKAEAYWVLRDIMSQLYRELKTLDAVISPLRNMKAWYSLHDAIASGWTELDKVMWWMGRFWLLPWMETYDLKKIPEKDDFIWMLLMNVDETNESLKTSNRLKAVAEIDKLLNPAKDEYSFMNLLTYMPVLKHFFKDDPAISETMYNQFLRHTESDSVIKNLYAWKFDPKLLNSENTYRIFSELTEFDLSSNRVDQDLKTQLHAYWLTEMKNEAFMKLLWDKMWETNLMESISKYAPNIKEMQLAKIIAFAESEVPGSSRVVLSYLANTAMEWMTQKVNMNKGLDQFTAKSMNQLTEEELIALQQWVIQQYYPSLFVSDKTSWFRLVEERLKQLNPKGFTTSPALAKFVNSLWFLDLIAYNEWRKWDTSAWYIKNVYSYIGKYVTDPKHRLNLMSAANETIQNLTTDRELRNTLQLWTVLWNIDILDKVLKDESFMKANWDIVSKALDIVFGTVDWLNQIGLKAAREEIWDAGSWGRGSKAYRQWLYSAWKKYTPWQYDSSNRKAAEELQDKMPRLLQNIPQWYSPKRSNSVWYNVDAKYNTARPVQYNDYLYWEKAFNANKAESAQLVTWYVRRNPADVFDKSTTRSTYKTPQFKTAASIKIPKWKRIWKNIPYNAES